MILVEARVNFDTIFSFFFIFLKAREKKEKDRMNKIS